MFYTEHGGPLSWGMMKIIMRHFAAEADQGRGQSAALLRLLGWMGLSQFSWALLPTLSAGQAGDGLELGAHSLVRKEQCMVVGRDQMEDPLLGAAQFTTHSSSHHDGDGEGTEAVVVSPDSHPEGGMLNAHLSQWRHMRLDKVREGSVYFNCTHLI